MLNKRIGAFVSFCHSKIAMRFRQAFHISAIYFRKPDVSVAAGWISIEPVKEKPAKCE